MADWYVLKRDNSEFGPITSGGLRELADSGRISEQTRVRRDDRDDYVPAGSLPGLFREPSGYDEPVHRGGGAPKRKRPWGPKSMSSGAGIGVMLIIASVMLIASVFLPWWSATMYNERKSSANPFGDNAQEKAAERRDAMREAGRELETFYRKMTKKSFGPALRAKYTHLSLKERMDLPSVSMSIMGWTTGIGIAAIIFGVAILVMGILPMSAKPLRPLKWIFYFVALGLAIGIGIWALIWWLGCSGKDVDSLLSQGGSFGVFLAMGGAVMAIVASLIGALMGVTAFTKRA